MSIITEEVLLDETGDDLNERQAKKGGVAQPILIEDLGYYDTKRILSSLTNIRVEVTLIFCHWAPHLKLENVTYFHDISIIF